MNKRYDESSIAIGSGMELGHDEDVDEAIARDGDLRVGQAELSLGQRLASVVDAGVHRSSDSEDGKDNPTKSQSMKMKSRKRPRFVPANSLTRTLIQALHSSDTKLTETCLAHSNVDLIRNTVKRLPPQLAIPLLNACVERLGRGARVQNMKGGGAGASAQRGMTLVTWIKTVLTIHTGHLMTVPDLVARLSGLHATLTARLALQERLLSLSGKLDMVLLQIEMHSLMAPKDGKPTSRVQESNVKHYVEGESDASDGENARTDVELEIGDEGGSMENVELGGDSEDKDEDGESDDEDDDEDDDGEDDDDDGSSNDFIDNEAEECNDDGDDGDDETE